MTSHRLTLGKRGEKLAEKHLLRAGYKILARNYRVRFGEIDLVADHGGTLVFIEVKTRMSTSHGQPFEALTKGKRQQISRVALDYIGRHGLDNRPARFDVVAVTFDEQRSPLVEVVQNAFDLCYGGW